MLHLKTANSLGAPLVAVGARASRGGRPDALTVAYQMMRKFRLESNAELVQFAIRQGVIT